MIFLIENVADNSSYLKTSSCAPHYVPSLQLSKKVPPYPFRHPASRLLFPFSLGTWGERVQDKKSSGKIAQFSPHTGSSQERAFVFKKITYVMLTCANRVADLISSKKGKGGGKRIWDRVYGILDSCLGGDWYWYLRHAPHWHHGRYAVAARHR